MKDLGFNGCASYFACKLKNKKFVRNCALKDELTEVLQKANNVDVIILRSPIYVSDVSSSMRAFLERFLFMNASYSNPSMTNFTGSIDTAFIYTMNSDDEHAKALEPIYNLNARDLEMILNGNSEYYLSTNTYQFDDYSKYDAILFDGAKRAKHKEENFDLDCKNSFEIGKRLASK